jgi:ribosomal protein S18 acetylase RimI-like enzyme
MNSLIEKGKIKKPREHDEKGSIETDYEMRFLDENAARDVFFLQESIIRSLRESEIFKGHDGGYLEELFLLERSAIGVLTNEGLIAYNLIHIPSDDLDNLGTDLKFSKQELKRVIHLQASAVHPAYRGNALQTRMIKTHLAVIRSLGFEHVCCTVSPKNPASLRNVLAAGFQIRALKPKFHGWWRFIMHKNILHPATFSGEEIKINGSDIHGQLSLLDKGFSGTEMIFLPDGYEICYRRNCTSL